MLHLEDFAETRQLHRGHRALVSTGGDDEFAVAAVHGVVGPAGYRAGDDLAGVRIANDDDRDGSGRLIDGERIHPGA